MLLNKDIGDARKYLTDSERSEAIGLAKKNRTVYEDKRLIKLYIKEKKFNNVPVSCFDEDHELYTHMLITALAYFKTL